MGGVEEVTNKAGEPDDQTGDIQDAAETQTSVETQTGNEHHTYLEFNVGGAFSSICLPVRLSCLCNGDIQ